MSGLLIRDTSRDLARARAARTRPPAVAPYRMGLVARHFRSVRAPLLAQETERVGVGGHKHAGSISVHYATIFEFLRGLAPWSVCGVLRGFQIPGLA